MVTLILFELPTVIFVPGIYSSIAFVLGARPAGRRRTRVNRLKFGNGDSVFRGHPKNRPAIPFACLRTTKGDFFRKKNVLVRNVLVEYVREQSRCYYSRASYVYFFTVVPI